MTVLNGTQTHATQIAEHEGRFATARHGLFRPVVAIYRSQLLPLSETFIKEQALAFRRWAPVLVGERKIDKLPLDELEVNAAYRGPATLPQRLVGAAYRSLRVPHPGVYRLIRDARPTLIHAHFGFDGVEAWPIARRLGVPLLVTLHGSDITTSMDWFAEGKGGWRWRSYPRRLAEMSNDERVFFVAVSENIRKAALTNGLPDRRISVRPIGIDVERFGGVRPSPSIRRAIVLFVGRLVEKKGAGYLLEAFERVLSRCPEAELVIAGDGPQRAALQVRYASIPRVKFLGAVSHDRVLELLGQSRVLCLPSVTAANGDAEGLPIVLLEAQASGVPVVTSARGGATEGIIDGVTGFAVAERDVTALTDRLILLMTDDDLADRFATAGSDYIRRHHNIQNQTERLEALYDRVAGTAPTGITATADSAV